MLTIKDLSASKELDRAAMADVLGGSTPIPVEPDGGIGGPSPFPFGFLNAPIIDAGYHSLYQGQALGVHQNHNLGGLNLVINNQQQNGISGQAVG